MRFVHTDTLEMVEKMVKMESMPPYGILSHRWEEEEMTFQEMLSDQRRRDKKGFEKIKRCCEKAKEDHLKYIWVDTCCIDKTSSSELQESLNSMFQWYQNAAKCYAYLFDVQSELGPDLTSFRNSEWFKRGWTLQELLAPTSVMFYGQNWSLLGDKQSLKHEISVAARISPDVLDGRRRLQDICVAERMSWASKRVTEREEDRAYSLLGVFDVRMPMLYGEGKRAFVRLQEEIIKHSDDHTLFAWQGIKNEQPGMLALEPDDFEFCRDVVNIRARKGRHPYSMTNRGLSITLSLKPWTTDTYLAVINCCRASKTDGEDDGRRRLMGIFLRRLSEDDQYARVRVCGKDLMIITQPKEGASGFRDVSVNIRQAELPTEEVAPLAEERLDGFRISANLLEHDHKGKKLFEIEGNLRTDREKTSKVPPGSRVSGIVGTLDILKQKRKIKVIRLGFDFDFNPVCFLAESAAVDQKVRIIDRSGKFAPSDDRDLSPEERHSNKGIRERFPDDEMGWNRITLDGKAHINQGRDGLWALKGDRLTGLDVVLSSHGASKDERIMVFMRRETVDGQMGWVFGIEDSLTSTWRKARSEEGQDGRTRLAKLLPL